MKLYFIIGFCLAFAAGQPYVVDRNQFYTGDTFIITCDISRFGSNVPSTTNYFDKIIIQRKNLTSSSFQNLVTYNPGTNNPAFQNFTNLPSGSNWTVQFSGGESQANNRNTIRIIATVYNARCDDAGLYQCETSTLPSADIFHSPISNLTALARVTLNLLSVTPYYGVEEFKSNYDVNETVTMTCTFKGPPGLKASWSYTSQGMPEQAYPVVNDIRDSSTDSSTTGSCKETSYTSVLSFQVKETDNNNAYFCIVKNGNSELQKANFSIVVNEASKTEQNNENKSASAGTDVGAIVGGVIGGVVFLVIIVVLIYFLIIRKRRQNQGSEDKHKDDMPSAFVAPPVFPAKSSKPPKDDSDGTRPTGMTNEGLDTSYDSKDMKGPPRYTNTEEFEPPRYEIESHRGRSNKAYEGEKEEKNGGHRSRRHRDRDDSADQGDHKDRGDRRSRHRDREAEPQGRRYSTEDNTVVRMDPGYGDPNVGTSI